VSGQRGDGPVDAVRLAGLFLPDEIEALLRIAVATLHSPAT
jgi:hypothetical protein